MTLQEFSRDVAPIVMMVLGVLGLGSLALLWRQIREAAKWNKLQGQAGFLNRGIESMELDHLTARLKTLGVKWYDPPVELPTNVVQAIFEDEALNHSVKVYL